MAGAMICKIDGCCKVAHGYGLCATHLYRMKKHGDPMKKLEKVNAKKDWVYKNKEYSGDDCLKWPFAVNENGRGLLLIDGKAISAPKAMCIAAHGNPPTSKHEAAHSCGNGHLGCMNPKHLRWATRKENEADKKHHGTIRQGTKINTHKLTEEQVHYIRSRKGVQTGLSLAKEFGVSATNISYILSGKYWKFLL